jgi:hypothetical protein
MDDLKLFKALTELLGKATASGMKPSEVAGCLFFALELLGEDESGPRPGYVVALGWLEAWRANWLGRLKPERPSHLN